MGFAVITEITLKITNITRMPEEQAEEVVKDSAKPEVQQAFAKKVKQALGLDDAVVVGVKSFVRGAEDGKID